VGTVALAGTFDTKGREFAYVKQILESLGNQVFTIHTGVYQPFFVPDVDSSVLADAMGVSIQSIRDADRGEATATLSQGFAKILPKLYQAHRFDGILSFGGSGGTSLVTPGMRELPIGVPKIMVSTVASGDTSFYVGTSDIMMMPSIVDVSGLNKLSKVIYDNAAAAISGMVNAHFVQDVDVRPLVGATMFGVTTPAVDHARELLDQKGYETLVFHATGTGGRTMEHLIKGGYFTGILDLTTTEMADNLVGGILSAGPHRLEAGIAAQIPQVISFGALDMVNFGPYDSVPAQFKDRNFFKHNPTTTLMRTTVAENVQLGQEIARKVNKATAPVTVMIPLKGISKIDAAGQPFFGPEEDAALFKAFKDTLANDCVKVIELDMNINDPEFTQVADDELLALIKAKQDKTKKEVTA
jgi:uncharacterized protein (UPF0261 family)